MFTQKKDTITDKPIPAWKKYLLRNPERAEKIKSEYRERKKAEKEAVALADPDRQTFLGVPRKTRYNAYMREYMRKRNNIKNPHIPTLLSDQQYETLIKICETVGMNSVLILKSRALGGDLWLQGYLRTPAVLKAWFVGRDWQQHDSKLTGKSAALILDYYRKFSPKN